MEHPDGVLYEDIFFTVAKAFYSAIVPPVADCAIAAGVGLVAVCPGVCCFAAGIHLLALSGQSETRRDEEVELFLSSHHVLCAPPVVWLG